MNIHEHARLTYDRRLEMVEDMTDVELGALVAVPLYDEILRVTKIEILTATGRTLSRAAEALAGELAVEMSTEQRRFVPKA